jgi:SAM-dependent methyltransferase
VKNIVYTTGRLARYFAHNRVAWLQFYESERVIIEQLAMRSDAQVLDVGCGCGGLGLALRERFGVRGYTGVEINEAAAETGRTMNGDARILCGDILDLSQNELRGRLFDVVFSLSCVDWNVRFADMLSTAWSHVRPGGHLVGTFRLTDGDGCNDITRSYQHINYEGTREGDRAAYVVVNARELLRDLQAFDATEVRAYGYWGVPSVTAITPYDRLCFSAFSVRKRVTGGETLRLDLNLPAGIRALMETASA